MSEENVEIVRKGLEALQKVAESGDPNAGFHPEILADDIEWIPTSSFPGPKSYRGREGVVEYMRTWSEDFESWSLEVERLIDAPDDRVVALVHQRAIGKGSGAPVEMRLAAVYDLEGGRVIRIQNFINPADALEAAGVAD
jgi:ketosteroid isomerase-like protein